MSTPLTFTHLRFEVAARTSLRLGQHQAGERLRDALAQVMLRAVCPETRRAPKPSPEHAVTCPACWLLAADTDPGTVRRAYSLVGPLPPLDVLAPGASFTFTLTLFGEGFRFLPYFVLAVPAMGETGIGPGRGQFDLVSIQAIHSLKSERRSVLAPGENVVRVEQLLTGWEDAINFAQAWAGGTDLSIQFLSPTRLVVSDGLVKAPDFGVFFQRMLERIDELARQYNRSERRALEDIQALKDLANQVRLVEQDTRWVDLWGPSNRTGKRTPMGGFVGQAVYRSYQWDTLLPWLLLGQGVQVGKLTAKGNGVFQVHLPGSRLYWEVFY